MSGRIPQEQADDAAASAATYWPEFGRRWPWMRSADVAPALQRIGEQTVALLRAFPAIQWSNQAQWYQRVVRDTPAILILQPKAFDEEARTLAGQTHSTATIGKSLLSLVYLPDDGVAALSPVAKTLLASTDIKAPFYTAQLAHEALNCFCDTAWDSETLRSGLRRTNGSGATAETRGGALNDLLLDAMLVHYLPATGAVSASELFDGAQGPYWNIALRLSQRLRGVPALPALFSGADDALARFERGLTLALDTADAAGELDRRAAAHDWTSVNRLLGA